MSKAEFEFIQLILISGYVLTTVSKEKWWSTLGCAWWCSVLFVDIFIWRLNRPPYAEWFLNLFDVGIGLVIIYAKFHKPLTYLVKTIVVFIGNML